MDYDPWNLSNLFRSPFGPNHPRSYGSFGPSRKNIVPLTPRKDIIPMTPENYPWKLPKSAFPSGIDFQPNLPKADEEMKKQKEKNKVKESMCQCGEKLKPIVVEVSFKLKNPDVTYVGDIFIEYCPACQDEHLLAHACKNASHKFLTNLIQKK